MKHQTARFIAALLALSALVALLTTAHAADLDYMAIMEAAAVTGDTVAGQAAEAERNAKIDALAIDTPYIAFNDLYLLSKIIYAEAGSRWLSDEWKMSVGEVVLNRVASPEFPNTIPEVLAQPGQYYGANSRYFEALRPDARCVGLAKRLLHGERVLGDLSVVFQANFKQGSGAHTAMYDKYLGWTYFCHSSRRELYA